VEGEALLELLVNLQICELFWGPSHNVLCLMGVRVFLFGEDVDDVTCGVIRVMGFQICSIDEHW
jgi:hypothetical protein